MIAVGNLRESVSKNEPVICNVVPTGYMALLSFGDWQVLRNSQIDRDDKFIKVSEVMREVDS